MLTKIDEPQCGQHFSGASGTIVMFSKVYASACGTLNVCAQFWQKYCGCVLLSCMVMVALILALLDTLFGYLYHPALVRLAATPRYSLNNFMLPACTQAFNIRHNTGLLVCCILAVASCIRR